MDSNNNKQKDSNGVFSFSGAIIEAGFNVHQKTLNKKLLQFAIVSLTQLNKKFLKAAIFGDRRTILECLSKGVSIDTQDNNNVTALMFAIFHKCTNTTQLLMERGLNVNLQDNDGNTALMIAVIENSESAFNLLLPKSDLTLKNANHFTALMYAAQYGHIDRVKKLLPLNLLSDIKTQRAQDQRAGMALFLAVQHGHESVVDYLTNPEMFINLNERGLEGNTALMVAAYNGFSTMVDSLIEGGADINAVNNQGMNALCLAIMRGHEQIAFRLMKTLSQKALDELEKDPFYSGVILRFKKNIIDHQLNRLLQKLSEVSLVQSRFDEVSSLLKDGVSTETLNKIKSHLSFQDIAPRIDEITAFRKERLTQNVPAFPSSNEAQAKSNPMIFRDITNLKVRHIEMSADTKKPKSRSGRTASKISSDPQKTSKTPVRAKAKNSNVNNLTSWRRPA